MPIVRSSDGLADGVSLSPPSVPQAAEAGGSSAEAMRTAATTAALKAKTMDRWTMLDMR